MANEKIKIISGENLRKREAQRRYRRKYYLRNSNPSRRNRPKAINDAERKRRISEISKKWAKSNPDKLRDYERKYRKLNTQFRLRKMLRNRLSSALRSQRSYKCNSTIGLLGCSINDFKMYLESKFEVGMSWNNYGTGWHIDHVIPCAIFDLSKPQHQKRCFHFSNMQPMWASENQKKHKTVTDNQFNLL